MQEFEAFWYTCLKHFEKELNAQQFNTWIKPLQLDISEGCDDQPILIAPNRFVLQWVKDNFIPHIEAMAQQHFSKRIQFQLVLGDITAKKTASKANPIIETPQEDQAVSTVFSIDPTSSKK